ncbi:hypothetical protein M8C13_26940 [Crossiella sp. SN42]|uniref:hypothetical protein n=1 Tax=Crossiella sp. SN42 TaxID=2944808 RepID=UPI00207CB5DC|nr:hypothetical protein [Crossiella sp. SN42]MCO1579392.1 hypothetical protein [Crossiella sp. SN42]
MLVTGLVVADGVVVGTALEVDGVVVGAVVLLTGFVVVVAVVLEVVCARAIGAAITASAAAVATARVSRPKDFCT